MKTLIKVWSSLIVWGQRRAFGMLIGVLIGVFGGWLLNLSAANICFIGIVGSIGCWGVWYFFLCTSQEHLEICRQSISYIDHRIADRLHLRREIVYDIADTKEADGMSVVDSKRVKNHIAGLRMYARQEGLSYSLEDIDEVFREIISKSTRYQHERRDKSSHKSPESI